MSLQSTLLASAARPGRSDPFTALRAAVSLLGAGLRRRAATLEAWRELQALSDRELTDIGLTRGQIHHAVRNGRA